MRKCTFFLSFQSPESVPSCNTDSTCSYAEDRLYVVGLICLFSIIWFCVANTNYFVEESDIVLKHVEEQAVLTGVVAKEQIEREHEKERIAEEKVKERG